MVLGSDPILQPGGAGAIFEVCDLMFEATFARARKAEHAHLRAASAGWRRGAAALKRDLHESPQGWNLGGWAWRAEVMCLFRILIVYLFLTFYLAFFYFVLFLPKEDKIITTRFPGGMCFT